MKTLEKIYEDILIANSHAANMKMDSVDVVYPGQFEIPFLKDFSEFIEEKGFYTGWSSNGCLYVYMDSCTIKIYKK